ncbi:MAG: zf-HC2 domain-containing protein [Ignavibacteriales bacterium]|nr:zf-HC2 domain-containing protein [Ignavibacteriales bacterium]
MTHERFRALLSAMTDDELHPTEQLEAQRHLDTCKECQAVLSQYRHIREHIRLAADVDVAYRFSHDVARMVQRKHIEEHAWEGIERSAQRALVALALFVAMVLAFTSFNQQKPVVVSERLFVETTDTSATRVLLKEGELSKDDVVYAVLTR